MRTIARAAAVAATFIVAADHAARAATLDVVVTDDELDETFTLTVKNDGILDVNLGGFTTRFVRDLHVTLPKGVTFGDEFVFLVGGPAPAFVTDFRIGRSRVDTLVTAPLMSGLDQNGDLILNDLYAIRLNGRIGEDIRVRVMPTTDGMLPPSPIPAPAAGWLLGALAMAFVGWPRRRPPAR